MSEPTKQQIGDGQDNFGQAAGQMAKAAKQASQEAAKKGAEATANAAAATVKAGVEGGKAVSEIAVGTAVGGPWGAILSAAWAMRHTLFKILICICLALTFLIVMIVSLPSIVADSVFGLSGTQPAEDATLLSSYTEMAEAVSDVVDGAYDLSLSEVERIIADGGYDYDLSMDALINYAQSSAGYDVCYILAAYSASMEQQNTSQAGWRFRRYVSGNLRGKGKGGFGAGHLLYLQTCFRHGGDESGSDGHHQRSTTIPL